MGPEDANINGNVHGGVILRLLEEAGAVEATRFCNKPSMVCLILEVTYQT